MQRLFFLVSAFFLLLSVITIQNVFADTKQFAVKPGQIVYYSFSLNEGDRMDFSIEVRGGSGNDINFEIVKPSGISLMVGGCDPFTCKDMSFTADENGEYTFNFDNTFSLVSSKNVIFDYSIQRNILSSGGCLIATATFGTELAPQVQMLREIRDTTVLGTQSGATFMTAFNAFYYSFSPTIADLERQNPAFKEIVKVAITPLLTSLSLLQYVDIDSETEMLGYGISVILLNVGMYFVAPSIVIIKIKNKIENRINI